MPMLEAVNRCCPEIYNFCYLSHASHSNLLYHEKIIFSQEGPQQGDPLGPLLFSLAIQPALSRLNSVLVLGYLDDVTVGGEAGRVAQDIVMFRDETAVLGLELNISKCEVITYEGTHLPFSDGSLCGTVSG